MAEQHTDQGQKEHLVCQVLTKMLALLRAQRWNYQTCHWQAKGTGYYGDHLMFQRLYEGLDGEVDTLAEKIVGIMGADLRGRYHFDNLSQVDMTKLWLESWSVLECPYRRSQQSEKDFQSYFKAAYDLLKKLGGLTLGLDDWIMATANAHETNSYLLQQRITGTEHARMASQSLVRGWGRAGGHRRARQRVAKEPSDKEAD